MSKVKKYGTKKILTSPEHSALKGCPNNAMTKNPVFASQLKTKTNWKNTVPSLVSRSNQDGIFKSNTALILAKIIVTDRNSKELQIT